MKHNFLKTLIFVGASSALSVGSVQAQTVLYDDTANYNTNLFSMENGVGVGNPISVISGSLTSFSFEYYATNTLGPRVGVDVQFYANDGPTVNGYKTPQDLFFDSGWYYNNFAGAIPSGPSSTGYNLNYYTSDFIAGAQNGWSSIYNLGVSGSFTFVITWTNITPNEIEMPLANNVPGQSTGWYWVNNNGTWSLDSQPNNNPEANFLVDFSGTVPEPSTFGLAALGGALLLGVQKLRRKG